MIKIAKNIQTLSLLNKNVPILGTTSWLKRIKKSGQGYRRRGQPRPPFGQFCLDFFSIMLVGFLHNPITHVGGLAEFRY